jgi:adenosylmethionine-8-amino-7-oxononanoate aminotransferase
MTRLLDILAEEAVLTRADTNLYLAPPLCIQRQEIDRLISAVDTALSRFEGECGYL